jgi:hypothetical protein
MDGVKDILQAPLPKAYVENVTGVVAVDHDTQPVGQGVRIDVFPRAMQDLTEGLDTILQSLEGWLNSYSQIKVSGR